MEKAFKPEEIERAAILIEKAYEEKKAAANTPAEAAFADLMFRLSPAVTRWIGEYAGILDHPTLIEAFDGAITSVIGAFICQLESDQVMREDILSIMVKSIAVGAFESDGDIPGTEVVGKF